METVKFQLTGVNGLVMHNGHLANPQNEYAKQLKVFTSKRKKTDADYEAIAHIEFLGALYLHENGNGLEIVLPADVIEAAIVNGAKKSRDGVTAKAAMFVNEHAPLEYDGDKNPEKLWEDKRFVFSRLVNVQKSKILKTRAFFKNWKAVVTIEYNPDLCNAGQVEKWLTDAGTQVGVGTWRPKHGRFTVKRLG